MRLILCYKINKLIPRDITSFNILSIFHHTLVVIRFFKGDVEIWLGNKDSLSEVYEFFFPRNDQYNCSFKSNE